MFTSNAASIFLINNWERSEIRDVSKTTRTGNWREKEGWKCVRIATDFLDYELNKTSSSCHFYLKKKDCRMLIKNQKACSHKVNFFYKVISTTAYKMYIILKTQVPLWSMDLYICMTFQYISMQLIILIDGFQNWNFTSAEETEMRVRTYTIRIRARSDAAWERLAFPVKFKHLLYSNWSEPSYRNLLSRIKMQIYIGSEHNYCGLLSRLFFSFKMYFRKMFSLKTVLCYQLVKMPIENHIIISLTMLYNFEKD